MPLDTLPTFAVGAAQTVPTATDLNTIIDAINSGSSVDTEARTATAAPGGTTGVISVGTDVVTVTSDDANKVITLPDAALGTVITLLPTATGYELRSSAPATIGINGGTGANAESAIPAQIRVIVQRVTATNWVGSNTAADGTVTVTEVAA